MDTLTVNVPDEKLSIAVDEWEDGVEYDLRVVQVAPGEFDLISGEAVAEEVEDGDTDDDSDTDAEAETTKKVPARFAVLIGK